MDAFEKLNRLSLKEKQQREIIKVLVQCCIQEATFNLYYPLVAAKFCDMQHSFKITFQFTLWDSIKEFKELAIRQVSHLAKMTAKLVILGSVSINVLKILVFTELTSQQQVFCRVLFGAILSQKSKKSADSDAYLLKVFSRETPAPEGFRDGLLFFVANFVEPYIDQKEIFGNDVEIVARRLKVIKHLLE